ncbi:MAG: HAD family phosphatase [Ignavibacteriales bacterium]|nr:HAD family phosphatase [Ignavibacteriales bacterium]
MSAHIYSVIVFDLGNVLINFDYKIAVKKFDEIEPNLGKRFLEHHKNNYHIHRAFESGLINEAEFIRIALSGVNHKVDPETFVKIYSDIFTPNYDVIELLPLLKKEFKLILLSNTDPLHKKYGWEKYEFLSVFDHLVLSFETGAVKPEEKIYREVERLSEARSQNHLYIDDIAEYTEAAKKLGWDAIQFLNYNQLLKELQSRNIL